eukprot:tig00020675_g12593.t1
MAHGDAASAAAAEEEARRHAQDKRFSPLCGFLSGGSGRMANGTHPQALDLKLLRRVHDWVTPFFPATAAAAGASASSPASPSSSSWRPSYFKVDARGLEHIPADQPVILVWNHSGGSTALDAWGLFVVWYRAFGLGRPLRAMMHEAAFVAPYIGSLFTRLGMLRADPANARYCIERLRHSVMVAPGGDYEVFRPSRDSHTLCFRGRIGYARMALNSRTPVIPVAHSGAHDTLHVVRRGERLARLLGIHWLARFCVFPLFFALPFLVALGPFVHLPTPATLRYRLGAPIPLPPLRGEPTEEDVREYAAKVEGEMRRMLRELEEEEARRPLLERNKTRFWVAWAGWAACCAAAACYALRRR